ncbi:ABC transporter [Streptomyces sp. NPDC028635]|uniref:ABC transporter n=1 Tax=Streptomyces sp. NPDC028635 TaxID=3154800 RepID=UPI0033E33F32
MTPVTHETASPESAGPRAGGRAAALGALLAATARTLPRAPLLAGAALGLLTVACSRPLAGGPADPWLSLTVLRVAAVCLGLGLAFLLDDPARRTTETVPTGRALRACLRLTLIAPLTAGWWAAALLLTPSAARPPLAETTLEAVTLAMLALALAAVAVRRSPEPEPGRAAAVGVLSLTVLAALLPDRWGLFVAQGSPHWAAAHDRWATLLAVTVAVWGLSLPEPLRRGRLRSRPSGA